MSGARPKVEVIADEIRNTRAFIKQLEPTPERYLDMERTEGCLYMLGANLLHQLAARIEVMERHADEASADSVLYAVPITVL
jgi:Iap family predicted aminopeptidase